MAGSAISNWCAIRDRTRPQDPSADRYRAIQGRRAWRDATKRARLRPPPGVKPETGRIPNLARQMVEMLRPLARAGRPDHDRPEFEPICRRPRGRPQPARTGLCSLKPRPPSMPATRWLWPLGGTRESGAPASRRRRRRCSRGLYPGEAKYVASPSAEHRRGHGRGDAEPRHERSARPRAPDAELGSGLSMVMARRAIGGAMRINSRQGAGTPVSNCGCRLAQAKWLERGRAGHPIWSNEPLRRVAGGR